MNIQEYIPIATHVMSVIVMINGNHIRMKEHKKEIKLLLSDIDATKKRLEKVRNIECQERIDLAHKLRVLRRQRDEVMK